MRAVVALGFLAALVGVVQVADGAAPDRRNIRTGDKIPDQGYCDQPYVVITKDGNWLCVLTTGPGHEGQGGQHVVSTISADHGKTWSEIVDIEPAAGPEASWVVPLVTPGGRVYAFYTYNGERVNTLGTRKIRADMLGWYCYKYSDDNGRSWSNQRHRLPMRVTACDRGNDWGGEVIIFWGICKPLVLEGRVLFSFTKLGRYMLDQGEGWLFGSDNILTETDPARLHWELLPDGEHGIRNDEFGSVQEEHNLVPLSDGSLCLSHHHGLPLPHLQPRPWPHLGQARADDLHPRRAEDQDAPGLPEDMAVPNGNYLFWFHNHSGRSYQDRNPVWIAGGVERDGRIHWSQPEILLYDDDPKVRMSYPDLIEQDGRTWVTETQKSIARIHELDKTLLEGLWGQGECREVAGKGLALELGPEQLNQPEVKLPEKLDVSAGGLAIDLWVRFDDLAPGQVLLDSRTEPGTGLAVTTAENGTIRLDLSDGKTTAGWDCDRGLLRPGTLHHVAVIVDNGPKIITFVVDGQLCDGREHRQYGWGRYQGDLGNVRGTAALRIGPSLHGKLGGVRVYDRYLRTSEAVANFRAGP